MEQDDCGDDCDVELESIKDEICEPIRRQAHSSNDLYMLELTNTFDHKIADNERNDDRVSDGTKEDD